MNVIDIWNVETFDAELLAKLKENADAIEAWFTPTANQHGVDIDALIDDFATTMNTRTVRGWHYTRLIDAEVEYIRSKGLYPSSLETIRARLSALVDAGIISSEQADRLYASSPFHSQNDIRANRFWLTSSPTPFAFSGVTLLLGNWGGEGVYFWLKDRDLKELVAGIGKPRVLEVAVPLTATARSYLVRLTWAVLQTFGNTVRADILRGDCDFCANARIGPEAVRVVHTEGEIHFAQLGNGYPAEYLPE